jgi:membrane-bound lytic murein transglycosylase A
MSMQAITAWIRANPGEGAALMSRNPSFIFFRVIEGEGPVGAQGVVLTPGRSLAVDPDWVPLGLPVWIDTVDPLVPPLSPARPLRRLVVAQDTGAAIKGPVRADLFWGSGREAAERAGKMNESGRSYLLLPKSSAP